jgi:hypothetical protein
MWIEYTGRWRDRVGSYRPAREVINPHAYAVEELRDDRTPREFIRQHHYLHTMPAARFRFGLFWGGLLVGVAVFSHPANDAVLSIFPGEPRDSCELGRYAEREIMRTDPDGSRRRHPFALRTLSA